MGRWRCMGKTTDEITNEMTSHGFQELDTPMTRQMRERAWIEMLLRKAANQLERFTGDKGRAVEADPHRLASLGAIAAREQFPPPLASGSTKPTPRVCESAGCRPWGDGK